MNEFLQPSTHLILNQALQWVQSSPPLFNQIISPLCLNRALPDDCAPLEPDDHQLQRLAAFIEKKANPLLGIFYESLWQFVLNELPGCNVVAANLPVRRLNSGQVSTIGEFDLIYQHRDQTIHRELAVKFYLGVPESKGQWQQWVGPGLRDRLDYKMHRLLHHQTLLSETEAGSATLAAREIRQPLKKEILIQGRLFYPLGTPCPPPRLSNSNHLTGHWLTLSQFSNHQQNLLYQTSHKIQWLHEQCTSPRMNHEQLLRQLEAQDRPVYVRSIHPKGQQHLFIVPDHWPARATAYSRMDMLECQGSSR